MVLALLNFKNPVLGSGDAWKIPFVLNITFSRLIAICGQGFLPFLRI